MLMLTCNLLNKVYHLTCTTRATALASAGRQASTSMPAAMLCKHTVMHVHNQVLGFIRERNGQPHTSHRQQHEHSAHEHAAGGGHTCKMSDIAIEKSLTLMRITRGPCWGSCNAAATASSMV